MNTTVRVRYAPSPTGFQHLGGMRTALLNYLYARSDNGTFIVRVEDTDQKRSKAEFVDDLFTSLEWLGITPDEYKNTGPYAPYVQSKRKERYATIAHRLVDEGHAYYCYTSSVERSGNYDRSSRDTSLQQIESYKRQNISPVIRLKLPLEGSMTLHDMLLGDITRNFADVIVDPILLKSDGFPTYHLANVVDDHEMNITHVLRSQEWIPTTPAHLHMYQVLGWTPPQYCHLSMILGEDGQKLSKRHGALSVQDLRGTGILSQALINYLVLLGWSFDGSREFFTLQELVDLFKKGRINHAPAMFSMQKLLWFNAHYIRNSSKEVLAQYAKPYFVQAGYLNDTQQDTIRLESMIMLASERIERMCEATDVLSPIFKAPIPEEIAYKEYAQKQGLEIFCKGLIFAKHILDTHWDLDCDEQEQMIRASMTQEGLKLGQILMPLRIAVTGSKVSPPILPMLKHIDKSQVLDRIVNLLSIVQSK